MRLGEAAGLWGLGQNDRKHATCMPSGFESRLSLPSRRATHPADATIGHWGRVCTVKLAILTAGCKWGVGAPNAAGGGTLTGRICVRSRVSTVRR